MASWYVNNEKLVSTSIRTGSDSLDMRILNTVGSPILAGSRELAIVWHGGNSPYRLRIKKNDGSLRNLIDLKKLDNRWVKTDKLNLEQNQDYLVIVTDDNGQRVKGKLKAVDKSQLPRLPAACAEELKRSTHSEELRKVYFAAWLLHQNDGNWLLQAYQILTEKADSNPLAKQLQARVQNEDIWDDINTSTNAAISDVFSSSGKRGPSAWPAALLCERHN